MLSESIQMGKDWGTDTYKSEHPGNNKTLLRKTEHANEISTKNMILKRTEEASDKSDEAVLV